MVWATHHVIPTPCMTLGQVPSLWTLSSDKKIVFEEQKANCYYTMEEEIFFFKVVTHFWLVSVFAITAS